MSHRRKVQTLRRRLMIMIAIAIIVMSAIAIARASRCPRVSFEQRLITRLAISVPVSRGAGTERVARSAGWKLFKLSPGQRFALLEAIEKRSNKSASQCWQQNERATVPLPFSL